MPTAHAHPIHALDRVDDDHDVAPYLSTPAVRSVSPENRARFEANLAEIFEAAGMDLDTPGTENTPQRFLQALLQVADPSALALGRLTGDTGLDFGLRGPWTPAHRLPLASSESAGDRLGERARLGQLNSGALDDACSRS